MGKLFGTDGIRGVANAWPMTPELGVAVGRAVAKTFCSCNEPCSFVVGRDTRLSGYMLESSIIAGLCASNATVFDAGEIPTPAVAYLVRKHGAAAGIVISASHNPYQDNGIKLFDGHGFKLDVGIEVDIEQRILKAMEDDRQQENEPACGVGRLIVLEDAAARYIDFLAGISTPASQRSAPALVLDCANGATSRIAQGLFETLGYSCKVLSAEPNGININKDCGSEHPENLAREVVRTGADAGLCFDGDGDRLIAVDEKGNVLTGDQVIAILAGSLKGQALLTDGGVVTTTMSNIGLKQALNAMGIRHETTDVGDRYVMQKMKEIGAVLGGEDSGHILFLREHTTGDGLLAGIRLLEALQREDKPLSEFSDIMEVFPQSLINVEVTQKPPLAQLPSVMKAIATAENELSDKGRVLVRYSGTQDICRVMVEGPSKEDTLTTCGKIAETIRKAIG
jgi:phosphoglucosamine mutase